jgi:type IV pilus assembly protein PilE
MYRCLYYEIDKISASYSHREKRRSRIIAVSSPLTRPQPGFTLIELMIVVAIVAILAAIAYPSYTNFIRKSHRAAAKTALLDLASREERFYSTNNNYSTSLSTLGYTVAKVPNSSQDYYTVSVGFGSSGDNSTFSLTATPDGDQQKDTCGTYTLDNTGAQGSTTSPSSCW